MFANYGSKSSRDQLNKSKMFVKIAALLVILGVCLAIPVDKPEHPVPVPVGVPSAHTHGPPSTPAKPDNSDLEADPSTWWHGSWYHSYPVYYYHVPSVSVPTYTYWHAHY